MYRLANGGRMNTKIDKQKLNKDKNLIYKWINENRQRLIII